MLFYFCCYCCSCALDCPSTQKSLLTFLCGVRIVLIVLTDTVHEGAYKFLSKFWSDYKIY